jgi:5-methylcytosine-specific restriction protein A
MLMMPNRPPTHRGLGQRTEAQRRQAQDSRRGSSRQRGYTRAWEKARAAYLRRHPLCVMCGRAGRCVAATVVDHLVPHRGDAGLFWDEANWQALCGPHHDCDKQREERGRTREDVRELFPFPIVRESNCLPAEMRQKRITTPA